MLLSSFLFFSLSYKVQNMKSTPLWILVFVVFVSHIIVPSNSAQVVADSDDSGGISIDCGVNQESWDGNQFYYEGDDTTFVEFGEIHVVSSEYNFNSSDEQVGKQLNTLRSFPEGERNCYTLRPKQGKNNNYLIRAYFAYGNYDNKNSTPHFELHLGVNFWTRIDMDSARQIQRKAVVHVSPTNNIDVCLINTGKGMPFISLLELWPLSNSIYRTTSDSLPLDLLARTNLGMPEEHPDYIRYADDIYGRAWFNGKINNSVSMNTSEAIDCDVKDYKLPKEVLNTAVRSQSVSSSLVINLDYNADFEYYVYLHFFDFEQHSQNLQRSMEIAFTDIIRYSITLEYQKLYTMIQRIPNGVSLNRISITSTPGSSLPPMINAYETYRVLPQPNPPTNEEDVDAMRNIEHAYNITRISWQGDPCMPKEYRWEGLICNYSESIPRVTSLNLSSSKLTGMIASSFFHLTRLESLDLSNNQLTGEIPEFLAKLLNLKLLNLTGNDIKGLVPKALREKSGLILSLDGNPGLCQTKSCEIKTQKSIILLVTSVAGFVTVLVIMICISVMLYKRKRKNQSDKKDGQLKSKNRAFCHAEVLSITNDFETVIGEGGFGKVYLGTLHDGTEVAIKLLSKSSQQGFKEFQSEAELLTIVHHRNLVSLVGYCDDGDMKALVYEYMTEGNLRYHLSDKNPNVLKWNVRLQIAMNAACGLDYLHNGCKPPIIHRDLKSSNILLGKDMQAKLADFGLSRAFDSDIDTHVSTNPAGTIGYLDPEFHSSGKLNKKSDIYSFGIILLELMTGRPAVIGVLDNASHLSDWVIPKLESGDIQSIMDPRLEGKFSIESAWKFLEIAMSCIPPTTVQRPDISQVVTSLKECLALELSLRSANGNSKNLSTTFDINYFPLELESAPYAR